MFIGDEGSTLPVPAGISASDGSAVIYGVRPEHFDIAQSGLPLVVSLIEPMGSDTQITGVIGTQTVVATFHRRVSAEIGETMHLRPAPGESHLFDAGTGRSIKRAQQ
jgi:multiple sugar transport system ATP-binding protein